MKKTVVFSDQFVFFQMNRSITALKYVFEEVYKAESPVIFLTNDVAGFLKELSYRNISVRFDRVSISSDQFESLALVNYIYVEKETNSPNGYVINFSDAVTGSQHRFPTKNLGKILDFLL